VKLPKDFSEQSFIYIFAHEFKHYLDFNKKFSSKYKWWEKRANKFAKGEVDKWRKLQSSTSEAARDGEKQKKREFAGDISTFR
jgi:hypothetical protein